MTSDVNLKHTLQSYMINIVGSLRIEVPGTKVWSEQECSENLNLCNTYKTYVNVKKFDKKTKKHFFTKECIEYTIPKCKGIIKVMPLTDVAVKAMIEMAPAGCPISRTQWKKLPVKEKLMWHFKDIAHDAGGKVYDFNLLP